jgi:hypothetical protein
MERTMLAFKIGGRKRLAVCRFQVSQTESKHPQTTERPTVKKKILFCLAVIFGVGQLALASSRVNSRPIAGNWPPAGSVESHTAPWGLTCLIVRAGTGRLAKKGELNPRRRLTPR